MYHITAMQYEQAMYMHIFAPVNSNLLLIVQHSVIILVSFLAIISLKLASLHYSDTQSHPPPPPPPHHHLSLSLSLSLPPI